MITYFSIIFTRASVC